MYQMGLVNLARPLRAHFTFIFKQIFLSKIKAGPIL